MKKSKFFIFLLILINISSLVASEITSQSKVQSSFANKGDIVKQLFLEDDALSYDAVITLLDELENGFLDDVCAEEDWYKINNFLAFLSFQSIMPNTSNIDRIILEQDIENFLNQNNELGMQKSFYGMNDVLKIIKPNGQWIGKVGTKPYIRLFEGGQKESINIFNKLTKNAKAINNASYPGKMFVLEDGTYRL